MRLRFLASVSGTGGRWIEIPPATSFGLIKAFLFGAAFLLPLSYAESKEHQAELDDKIVRIDRLELQQEQRSLRLERLRLRQCPSGRLPLSHIGGQVNETQGNRNCGSTGHGQPEQRCKCAG